MNTDRRTYVIAEAGVNHNGSLDMAVALIDAAADAGADAIKFQTFRAENLVSRRAPKAEYQLRTTSADESQFEMIRRLELDEAAHILLMQHARNRGIEFLSTPFDRDSLELLAGRFGMETIKVPSGEITNAPFLLEVARRVRRVIVSTGMCDLGEVEAALGVLAFGFTAHTDARPSGEAFARALASEEGQQALQERVRLLHCTTEYPAPVAEVNLRALDTLSSAFGLPTGYSDHTAGIHVSLAAVARGACIIEKHFTLNRTLPGPDHAASLEPAELKEMVAAIRDIEAALGDGIKRPTPSEWKNREVARESLVAACRIEAGEAFSMRNLTTKRPGSGLSPYRYWDFLGRIAGRSYDADEPISE
jgi:N-acetylneuraminate synthase